MPDEPEKKSPEEILSAIQALVTTINAPTVSNAPTTAPAAQRNNDVPDKLRSLFNSIRDAPPAKKRRSSMVVKTTEFTIKEVILLPIVWIFISITESNRRSSNYWTV